MKRLDRKKRDGLGVGILLVLIGIVAANMLSASPPSTAADTPPAAEVASEHYEPAAPSVVGANTTISVPKGVEVRVNGAPAKSAQPAAGPAAPTPVTPETLVINLKTPLRYTVRPGETSKPLSHVMVDGVHYEWQPSKATVWKGQTPDPAWPVWATIATPKPSSPYISDRVAFTVQAAPTAKPGNYNVEILIVLRQHITAGIPVVVTVQ